MKDYVWIAVACVMLGLLSVQLYREFAQEAKAYTFDEFGHRCIVAREGNVSAMWCFELEVKE